MKYIICDLDGTLSLTEHRQYFLDKKPADWDGFFLACGDDSPNWPVIYTIAALYDYFESDGEVNIVIFSGRSDIALDATRMWLAEFEVKHHELRMRKQGDFTPDDVLKQQWLDEIGKENVLFCIDDRQKVVDMWREQGLACFQVAAGDF